METFGYYIGKIFENYRSIDRKIEYDRELLNELWYDLENVKGINYSKQKFSYNEQAKQDRYYHLSDRIQVIEEEIKTLDLYMNALKQIYSRIEQPLKEQITEEYISDNPKKLKKLYEDLRDVSIKGILKTMIDDEETE